MVEPVLESARSIRDGLRCMIQLVQDVTESVDASIEHVSLDGYQRPRNCVRPSNVCGLTTSNQGNLCMPIGFGRLWVGRHPTSHYLRPLKCRIIHSKVSCTPILWHASRLADCPSLTSRASAISVYFEPRSFSLKVRKHLPSCQSLAWLDNVLSIINPSFPHL
jgi:hypothetical protein